MIEPEAMLHASMACLIRDAIDALRDELDGPEGMLTVEVRECLNGLEIAYGWARGIEQMIDSIKRASEA